MKTTIEWIKLGDELLADELDVLMCDSGGNLFIGYVDDECFYNLLLFQIDPPMYWAYLPHNPISIKKCVIMDDECIPALLK